MLALFFKSVKRPDVPASMDRNSKEAFYFVKDHYWDGVSFDDARLLHTPFFDPKIDEYFKYYVSPEPDSVKEEVNYMLLSARTNKDMFQYLLGKFTDKYINPEIMGQDKVFLFLFDNFFANISNPCISKSGIFTGNHLHRGAPPLKISARLDD